MVRVAVMNQSTERGYAGAGGRARVRPGERKKQTTARMRGMEGEGLITRRNQLLERADVHQVARRHGRGNAHTLD